MAIRIRVDIPDLREMLRAFSELERDAQNYGRDEILPIAQRLADQIKAYAQVDSRQSAEASKTVEAVRDRFPVVAAGRRGPKKAKALLLGSEFGATRKFGWYNAARYYDSQGKQFRSHLGAHSYWFFRTYEREKESVVDDFVAKMNEILDRWGRG